MYHVKCDLCREWCIRHRRPGTVRRADRRRARAPVCQPRVPRSLKYGGTRGTHASFARLTRGFPVPRRKPVVVRSSPVSPGYGADLELCCTRSRGTATLLADPSSSASGRVPLLRSGVAELPPVATQSRHDVQTSGKRLTKARQAHAAMGAFHSRTGVPGLLHSSVGNAIGEESCDHDARRRPLGHRRRLRLVRPRHVQHRRRHLRPKDSVAAIPPPMPIVPWSAGLTGPSTGSGARGGV